MKKAMKKFKQTLSILLAVAMVITMIPATPVSAAELNTVEQETTVESEETTVETSTEETVDETAADSEEAPSEEVVEETPAEETTEETTEEVVEEGSEETTETTEETVVEAAPVEEAEEIVEGEVDGAETYAIAQEVTATFADSTTATVDGQTLSSYTDTVTAGENYTFEVAAVNGNRVANVTAALTDAPSTGLTVTPPSAEFGDGTYTIATDVNSQDISANFTVTITTVPTRVITVAWTDTNIASVTDGTTEHTTSGGAYTVDDDATTTLTVTVADAVKATHKAVSTEATATSDVDTTNGTYTFTVAASADDATVNFATEMITYTVTNNADAQKATVTAPTTVNATEALEFTVAPTAGNVIKSVSYTMGQVTDTLTEVDGKYTIPSVTNDVEINVTTAALYDVTVTDNNDNVTNVEYKTAGAANYADYTVAVPVEENTTITLRITVTEGYKPAVTGVAGITVTPTAVANVYETSAITVTGVTTLDVTAAAKPVYTITEDIAKDAGTPPAPTATITYEAGCTTGTAATDLKTVADKDLVFTVAPKTGYYVADVKYSVENGDTDVALTKDAATGKYTITADKVIGNVTITVTTEELADKATVKFTVTDTEATVTDTADKAITSPVENVPTGADYSFKVAAKAGYRVTKVEVAQAATDAELSGATKIILTATDGVYKFTPVKDFAEVTVTTEELPKHIVSFNVDDTAKVKVDEVKVNDGAPADTNLDDGLEVTEGDKVTFKVVKASDASVYKVGTVKVGAEDVPEANGVYTLEEVTADTTVGITSVLDPALCNVIDFEVDGLTTSYTATVDGADVVDSQFLADKTTTNVTVALTAETGYTITKVELNGTDITNKETPVDHKKYTVDFSKKRDNILKVTTAPAENTVAKTVAFTDNFYKLGYKVTTEEGKVVAKGNGVYDVTKAAEYFEFAVTTPDKNIYTFNTSNTDDFEVETTTAEDGKAETTTYRIAAALLNTNHAIDLTETIENITVKVVYDNAQIYVPEVNAGNDGAQEDLLARAATTDEVTVDYGTPLNITVKPREGFVVTAAHTEPTADPAEGEKTKTDITVQNNGFKYSFVPTENTTVVITSEGVYNVTDLTYAVAGGTATVTPENNGSYTIDAGVAYTADVTLGAGTDVKVSKAVVKDVKGKALSEKTTAVEKNGAIELTVDAAADAGKTLKVDMIETVEVPGKPAEGETPEVPATTKDEVRATYTLNVRPGFTEVAVAGVSKDGKLAQTIDTYDYYKVTVTPKTAKAVDLGVKVTPDTNAPIEAFITDTGMLCIKTLPAKASATATIEIYDQADAEKKALEGGTIEVTTTVPAVHEGELTVTQKAATSTGIRLTLNAPKEAVDPEEGTLEYKVTVTPKDAVESGKEKPKNLAAAQTVVIEDAALTQDSGLIEVFAPDTKAKDGTAWDFDVKVELVQKLGDKATEVAFTSKTAEFVASTKDPSFEYKLGVKKGQTTVYTGQTDVLVGTANFGKETSYIYDIDAKVEKFAPANKKYNYTADEINSFTINRAALSEGQIVVNTTAETAAGKYTVRVTAYAPDTMYETTTTLVVNVVNGINEIDFRTTPDRLYKAEGKAASLKVVPVFNDDDPRRAPKAKKVTWDIVDGMGSLMAKDHPLYKMISIKNGTVSVNKNYKVSDINGDAFNVRVFAADYKGNRYSTTFPITITSQPVELGKAALIYLNNGKYEVIADNTSTAALNLTVEQLLATDLVAFRADAPEKVAYTYSELQRWTVDNDQFAVKSSNKAVNAYDSGDMYSFGYRSNKPAKKVSLTLTTRDGGKDTVKISNINVNYADVEGLGLEVARVDYENRETVDVLAPTGTTDISYAGTKDTNFEVTVLAKEGVDWTSLPALTSYSVRVSGGKLLSRTWEDTSDHVYKVLPTAAKTIITLKDNDNKVTTKYTLTNTTYSKEAAPSVKTTDKLYGGNNAAQKVTYKLSGKYDYAGKYVLVSTDSVARLDKKSGYLNYTYGKLEDLGTLNTVLPVKADGTFDLKFAAGELYTGNYKLSFTFGTVDKASGDFIADAKPVASTLKVLAQTNASFKLTTKYKLTEKEGYRALLTGAKKGNVNVTFFVNGVDDENLDDRNNLGLYNANIKGQENKFRDLFEVQISHDNEGNVAGYYLAVKADAKLEDLADKNNLKGYVRYRVSLDDSKYGKRSYEEVTPITVTIADAAQRYTVTSASVYASKPMLAEVEVKSGKYPAAVAHVLAEGAFDNATVQTYEVEGTTMNSNVVKLTKADALAAGSYPVVLYVVPVGSYYENAITAEQDAAKKKDLIKAHGVELKTTIKVMDASETAKVITLGRNQNKAAFVADSYDFVTRNYTVASTFTQKVQDVVKAGTVKATAADEAQKDIAALFKVGVGQWTGGGAIYASVNQAELDALVAAKKAEYGAAVTVDVAMEFASGNKQTVQITYTLPAKAQTFAEAVEAVDKAAYSTVITEEEFVKWEADMPNATEDEVMTAIMQARIMPVIEGLVADGTIKRDSNLNPDDIRVTLLSTDQNTFTATARIIMPNPVAGNESWSDIVFTLKATEEGVTPAEVIGVFNQLVLTIPTNADATYSYVYSEALKEFESSEGEPLPENLRLRITNLKKTEATANAEGSVTGKFVVTDIKYGYATQTSDPFNFTIAQKMTLAEAQAALEAMEVADQNTFTNLTSKEDVLAAMKAAITNADITVEFAKDKAETPQDIFNIVKATVGGEGSITCTVNLSNEQDDAKKIENLDLTFAIAALREQTAVITAVTDAVNAAALPELVKSNVADTVKTDVLAAANKAVGKDLYVVEYAKKADTTDDFAFVPVKFDTDGSLKANLAIFALDAEGNKGTTAVGTAAIDYTITKQPALETLEEAVAAIDKAFKSTEPGDFAANVGNDTTADDVKAAAVAAVANATFTVEAKADSFTLTRATFAAAGEVKGTLVITKADEELVEYEYTFAIDKLEVTDANLQNEVKLAVNAVQFTNEEVKDDAAKATAQAKLLEIAKKAVEGSGYTVEAADKALTVSGTATINNPATASITFTAKKDTATVAITCNAITVVATQTLAAAKAAVAAEVAKPTLEVDVVLNAEEVIAAVKAKAEAVVSNVDYTVEWQNVNYDAGTNTLTGRLYIYNAKTRVITHTEYVDVNATVTTTVSP